jgi:hypothetical protein
MTANEMADRNEWACCAYSKEVSAMLRQQQAEIEALKVLLNDRESDIYATGYWNGIAKVKPRELTDEEIKQIFLEQTGFYFDDNPADDLALMDFARAILKKASEK